MNRKTKVSLLLILTLALFSFLAAPLAASAADAAPPGGTVGSPAQVVSPWAALIPLVVPVMIAMLKAFLPNIPRVWLPIIAPVLGAAAEIGLHYAGFLTLGPLWGAVLGSAGVGLRELQHQVKQAILPTSVTTSQAR